MRKYIFALSLIFFLGFAVVGYARITNPESFFTFMSGGSATNGSIIFTDGTAFVQDNSNLFYDDTNNRLGLGTTTPQNKLHIWASEADAPISFTSTSTEGVTDFDWTIGLDITDGSFRVSSSTALGTNDRLVIDGNGNVGIGSSTPSTALSVGTRDASTTISTGQFQIQAQDTDGVLWCVVLGPDGAFSSVAGVCQ